MAKNDFGRVARRIEKATQVALKRSLERATNSGKTYLAKALKEETGLPVARIKKRMKAGKAGESNGHLKADLLVGVKVGIPLTEFKPKRQAVKRPGKSKGRGRPKSRTYFGVSVKVGRQPRQLVPGGFLANAKNGKQLVLGRKGKARLPTTSLRINPVRDVTEARKGEVAKHMSDSAQARFDAEMKYAMSKIK